MREENSTGQIVVVDGGALLVWAVLVFSFEQAIARPSPWGTQISNRMFILKNSGESDPATTIPTQCNVLLMVF
jgi:hypothetical protein